MHVKRVWLVAVALSTILAVVGCRSRLLPIAHTATVYKWGFIDRAGKVAIPATYDRAGIFSGGLAPVAVGRKWGYIDKSGRMVIAPRFRASGGFCEGLASVLIGNRWGYIDKRGRVVIKPRYVHSPTPLDENHIWDFSEGRACFVVPGNALRLGPEGGG